MHKFFLYFNTIRYLKFIQIYYRIYYYLKKKLLKLTIVKTNYNIEKNNAELNLQPILKINNLYQNNTFTFLNLSKHFIDIQWDYNEFGKLWAYNLNYFDFINQEKISFEDSVYLIKDFIQKIKENKTGIEPYPTSIRGINWIKFIVTNYESINKELLKKINSSLYFQMRKLYYNLEYHLLGNHLLENAFSLLYSAYYFNDRKFYKKAHTILKKELKEQILPDGGHFELSPMYHQIILYRLLDCYNLVKNNDLFEYELIDLIKENICIMFSWLNNIMFRDRLFPLFNDSAFNIAPDYSLLSSYSACLGINSINVKNFALKESGYRKFCSDSSELIVDAGSIGPEYLTGHSHCDTFNFELYIKDLPIITDTGTSTYSDVKRRMTERSTSSHNTVMIENYEQSEIWAIHRVGKRAHTHIIEENENSIVAIHDGYKKFGIIHKRSFITSYDKIEIIDELTGNNKFKSYAFFHFHPDVELNMKENNVSGNDFNIHFNGEIKNIKLSNYKFAPEFNKLSDSKVIEVQFDKNLYTIIRF